MKRILLLVIFCLIILSITLYFIFRSDQQSLVEKESPLSVPAAKSLTETKIDTSALNLIVGRWVRPNGGYVLDIMSAGPDGKLNVGYFNPKSINVARSEWAQQEGKLYVMVELRDINYPGSMYGLLYIPELDRLQGNYFQAQENATFEVEFVRE